MHVLKVFNGSFLSVTHEQSQKKECVFKVVDELYTYIFSFLPLADQKNMIFVSKFWQKTAVLAITSLQIEKIRKLIPSMQNDLQTEPDKQQLSIHDTLHQLISNSYVNVESFLSYKTSTDSLSPKFVKLLKKYQGPRLLEIEIPLQFKRTISWANCYIDFENEKGGLHPFDLSSKTKNAVSKVMEFNDTEGAIELTSGMRYAVERDISYNYILNKLLESHQYSWADTVAEKMSSNPLTSPYYTIADAALSECKYDIAVNAAKKIPLNSKIYQHFKSIQYCNSVLDLAVEESYLKAAKTTKLSHPHKSTALEFQMIVLGLAEHDQFEKADELARRLSELNDSSRSYYATVVLVAKIKERKMKERKKDKDNGICIVQ